MTAFLKKLTSRKFIAAVLGVVVGVAAIFGVDGGTVTDIAGIITASASIVTYICTEGKIDAASVQNTITALSDGLLRSSNDSADIWQLSTTGDTETTSATEYAEYTAESEE